jgi:hypothetical protein
MWAHVTLCVVALAGAWWSAHRVEEKTGGPSSVTLLDAAAGDVATVTYRWDKGTTTTTLTGAGALRRADVAIDREVPTSKDKDKADPHAQEGDAAPPEALTPSAEREQVKVPGAKVVLTAIAALEPLRTKRSLGSVDAERLKAMGLSSPARSITITTKRGVLELELGESSYGAQGRYARVKGQPDVHLIDGAIASGLEGGAETLTEKRAVTLELDDITGFSVDAGGKSAAFIHVDKDQVSTRHFAPKDDAKRKHEAAGKVMTTLRNLRGTKLASKDVADKAAAVMMKFAVFADGGAQAVEVMERSDGEGTLLRAHGVTFEITSTMARELQDDVDAALAE